MGPSRWIAHSHATLRKLTPLYSGKSSVLLLKIGHAAGIEALLTGILGGDDISFCESVSDLLGSRASVLHGPPMILSYLLNFREKFGSFLNGLDVFYSGTDSLHPVIVEKLRSTGLALKIEQIYGTTETWRIKTETDPRNPSFFRITDPAIVLRGDEIIYQQGNLAAFELNPTPVPFPTKITLGDRWLDEGNGFGGIEPRRSWVANIHGEKFNLFDLENKLLGFSGIGEVHFRQGEGILGKLEADLMVLGNESVTEEALREFLGPRYDFVKFNFLPLISPTKSKIRRPGSGQR